MSAAVNLWHLMAHVKFKTRKSESANGKASIIAVLYVSDHTRPERAVNEFINPANFINNRVTNKEPNYTKINARLNQLETDLLELHKNHIGLDTSRLGKLMDDLIHGSPEVIQPEKKSTNLIEFVTTHIANCQKFKLVKKPTIETYQQTLDFLVTFSKRESIDLTFEAVTIDFYHGFTTFLYDSGHVDGTVGKHIKNLKKFMQDAFEEDLHTNLNFKKKKFKKPAASKTENIALSEVEITKAYSLDLSDSPELALHRDLFVFACWTGLRFGDLCNVRPEHIRQMSDGKYLQIFTEKTNEDVIIPFHPLCEAIYSQYNYNLPVIRKSENIVFNRHLKTICDRAGIKSQVRFIRTVRGVSKATLFQKFEKVSAHTARRSFATNCYLRGIPMLRIMAITGHKTEKSFLRYICISKEEHAKAMMKQFNEAPVVNVLRIAN
jgi:integrase